MHSAHQALWVSFMGELYGWAVRCAQLHVHNGHPRWDSLVGWWLCNFILLLLSWRFCSQKLTIIMHIGKIIIIVSFWLTNLQLNNNNIKLPSHQPTRLSHLGCPLCTCSCVIGKTKYHSKGKGKVFYGQEPPSGESTTT